MYVAEVIRIKGEVLFLRDDTAPAERCFHEALKIARKQDALFWELRVTLSFARMRATQGHAEEARQLLEAVYYRFTEGFEAPDLRAARAVLDELPAS